MSAARISEFMVAAGAFSVDPAARRKDEINRLIAHYEAVKRHLTAPCEKAVGRAVAAIGRDGVSEKTTERLRTALAGRMAVLASEKPSPPAAPAAFAETMNREARAQSPRLPYKDD